MIYSDHFVLADDYITHLDAVILGISDPFIKSRYAGFLSVSAVTVYELAIKTIFIDFAKKKHSTFGTFVNSHFTRINGRIKLENIKNEYVPRFGDKYLTRFKTKLDKKEKEVLKSAGASIKSSYSNIITWRNDFAHAGQIPVTATYDEVKKAYAMGKIVIDCLAESMKY